MTPLSTGGFEGGFDRSSQRCSIYGASPMCKIWAGVRQPWTLRSRVVDSVLDRTEIGFGMSAEVCALGEVLAQQSVRVLVGRTLPGAAWLNEVYALIEVRCDLLVQHHL